MRHAIGSLGDKVDDVGAVDVWGLENWALGWEFFGPKMPAMHLGPTWIADLVKPYGLRSSL